MLLVAPSVSRTNNLSFNLSSLEKSISDFNLRAESKMILEFAATLKRQNVVPYSSTYTIVLLT